MVELTPETEDKDVSEGTGSEWTEVTLPKLVQLAENLNVYIRFVDEVACTSNN